MISSSAEILFQLLRAALGNEVAVGELSSDIDWQEVIDLSFEQGVAAIAVDGLGFAHDNDGSTSLTTSSDDDNQERLGVRRMLEDILAPKQVRHFESRFLAHLNILRMLWTNRWKFRLYSDTSFLATVWRYVYGHWFDRDNV